MGNAIKLPETNCASIATATSSRVLFAIGQAHEMLRRVRQHVLVATEPCLERVFDWKDGRNDNFSLRLPTQSKSNRRPVTAAESNSVVI